MRVRGLDRPWFRPRLSTETTQGSSRRRERCNKVTPREVYHRDAQLGPFSESERQIALQTGPVRRKERDFEDFCRKLKEEDGNDQVRQEAEAQREDESSWRSETKMKVAHEEEDLALGGDESAEIAAMYLKYCAANPDEEASGKDESRQTLPFGVSEQARESRLAPKGTGQSLVEFSAGEKRPTMKIQETLYTQNGIRKRHQFQKRNTLSKDRKFVIRLESASDHRHQQLERSTSAPSSQRGKRISRIRDALHEDARDGPAVQKPEPPPPNENTSPILGSIPESEAYEEYDFYKYPSASSALTSDPRNDSFGQLPHFSVTGRISIVVITLVVNHAAHWLDVLLRLPRHNYPISAYVIAGPCVVKDVFDLYLRIHQFWCTECPETHARSLVLLRIGRYQTLFFMAEHYGFTCAITLAWLVPLVTDMVRSISWLWRWIAIKEDPQRRNKDTRLTQLYNLDLGRNSWDYAIVWELLFELGRYALLNITFFLRDSWLSLITAMAFYFFVGSRYCPRLHAVAVD